jgi:hypothetical protein
MNLAPTLLRLARRAGGTMTEAARAQRRLAGLRLAYDSYVPEPDAAPAGYQEFLLRTSHPLLHEPSARERMTGRPVR